MPSGSEPTRTRDHSNTRRGPQHDKKAQPGAIASIKHGIPSAATTPSKSTGSTTIHSSRLSDSKDKPSKSSTRKPRHWFFDTFRGSFDKSPYFTHPSLRFGLLPNQTFSRIPPWVKSKIGRPTYWIPDAVPDLKRYIYKCKKRTGSGKGHSSAANKIDKVTVEEDDMPMDTGDSDSDTGRILGPANELNDLEEKAREVNTDDEDIPMDLEDSGSDNE